ncbi:hypothetical protein U5N28_02660 [Lysinibacillus telephonicus]|uniref:Uncharacterized protein n=1 Tax=Lysinibacillus telephonicus TaxID=1714840 RepID=A0A431UUE7_9BACI|nr:hypothetical protein [Lysinibacillus telephonicus]RTQ94120.1 hypothetical protein EKG35_06260 [Lysinibacillus telephonicus]
MTILNPRYAFLEADYANPNLNQALWNLEDSSEIENESGLIANAHTNTMSKIIPPNVYLKISPLLPFLNSLPVDIYCIAILLLGEFFYK